MRRTILTMSLCFCALTTRAFAWDWSVQSTLSETVEANSNQFLISPSAGGTLGSYSTITTNAEARTASSRLLLDGDITYQKYWGPGTAAIPQSEFRQDGVHARYEMTGKDPSDLSYIESSWRESSTSLAILSNLGIATNAQGFIDTSTIRGGIERDLTYQDFVTLSGQANYSYYDPSSAGIAFSDDTVTGTWRHRITSNFALIGSSQLELLNFQNSSNTNITITRNMAGVDTALSPLLNFRGTFGGVYLKSTQDAYSLPAGLPIVASASTVDYIADVALTYRLLKDTTLNVNGSRTVGPSVIGSLTRQTSLGASVTQTINSKSSLSFAASASRQETTTAGNYYSGSVTYSYQPVRDLTAQLTYRYLHRTALTGSGTGAFDPITGIPTFTALGQPADSNSIMIVVSKNFTVLPARAMK